MSTSVNNTTTTGRLLRIGLIAGATSAALFALNLAFARLSYRYGTNVHALNISRSILLMLVLAGFCHFKGLKLLPDRRAITGLVLIGACMAGQLFTLVGALKYMPVGLVMIVYFTYPLLVTAGDKALTRTWPRPLLVVAMLCAFGGLGLVLGPDFASLDQRGLLLAFGAAFIFMVLVISSSRSMQQVHPAVAMVWMMLVTSIVTGTVASVNTIAWPNETAGWVAFGMSATLFCLATILFFTSIHILGPVRAAILDNTAPVWGIVWGILLLSETLSAGQIIGAAVVVTAVAAAQWIASRD